MSILTAEPVEEYSYKPELVYETEKSGKRIIDIVSTKSKNIINSWVTFFKSKNCPIFATTTGPPKNRITLWIKETIDTSKKR
jgi:hypothetical protein